jgi:GNAT superfamily N-acetyltransferase
MPETLQIPSPWRPMTSADLPSVDAIARTIHAALPERPEIFEERLRLYPAGCYVLDLSARPAGYVVSHPWRAARPPDLDTLLGAIPADADTYYIHDIALLPEARQTGAGSRIFTFLKGVARRESLPSITLIAVYDAARFWRRHGLRPVEAPALEEKLAGYGPEACLMRGDLAKNPG